MSKRNALTDKSLPYQDTDEDDLDLELQEEIKQLERKADREEFFLYVLLGFMLAWGCGLFLDD